MLAGVMGEPKLVVILMEEKLGKPYFDLIRGGTTVWTGVLKPSRVKDVKKANDL